MQYFSLQSNTEKHCIMKQMKHITNLYVHLLAILGYRIHLLGYWQPHQKLPFASLKLGYFVSQGYEVVAPDLLGHGFSSCPDNPRAYTFSKIFKDIITIFDTYIPEDRKCIIFGHSYGCSFTTALTRVRMDKVVTLILIASGGPTPLAPPPHISKYPKCVKNMMRRLFECKMKSQKHKYSPRGKTIKFKETFDIPKYVVSHISTGALWPEGDAAFHRRITIPTLLVYGMRDTLVSLVEECEMERTLPR